MLKRNLIEKLAYPRYHIRNTMLVDSCPYNLHYFPEALKCRDCFYGNECSWLSENDEFVDLAMKSEDELLQALVFAIHRIDADVAYWGHNSRNCNCEACHWLRQAQSSYGHFVSQVHPHQVAI